MNSGLNRRKKNMMIGGLLAIVVIMGIAYAAFQTQLNINGTSTIDSKWDIKILSITPDKSATNSGTSGSPNYTTAGDISHSITNNDLTANFRAALVNPGDSVVYTVVVKNNGTLNAALKTLTQTDSSNPAITFTVEGIAENDIIDANSTKTFTVTVAYATVENQPSSTSSNLSITLDFVQTNSSETPAVVTPTLADGTYYSFNREGVILNSNEGYEDTPRYADYHGVYADLSSCQTNSTAPATCEPVTIDLEERIGNETNYERFIQSITTGSNKPYNYFNADSDLFFNKYVLSNGIITDAFSCFRPYFLDDPICIKGGDSSYFESNWNILEPYTTIFDEYDYGCGNNNSEAYCETGDFGVYAYPSGYIRADMGSGIENCHVNSDGVGQCS